jgi:hypothetical protein
MKLINKGGLLVLIALLLFACNIINPVEPIPAYITLDSIGLNTIYTIQGSASHKIKDAWIYVDDQPAGVYEMPCTVPLLYAGSHSISIRGGVLINGINATHLAYPYYQFVTRTVDLVPGEKTKLTGLVTTYFSGVTFALNEDFSGLFSFEKGPNSPIGMLGGNDMSLAFEGGYGEIKLDSGLTNFEVKSKEMILPNDGTNVFLEMNYKNSSPFLVVLQATDDFGNVIQNGVISLNKKDEWNKIYIELKPTMQLTATSKKFRLLFGTERTDVTTNEEFYFDNVKIVHN